MTKYLMNRLYLKKRLYMFSSYIKVGTHIKGHLNELNRIIMAQKNFGTKIDDEDQVLILLCSLPISYEHFVTILLYGKDIIFLEDVKFSLYSNELGQKSIW